MASRTVVKKPSVKKKTAKAPKKSAPKKSAPKKKIAPPVETLDRLHTQHPDAHCELDHANAFQLLCATVLSAQTTDVNVNKATPKLFARYPDAQALAKVESIDIEPYIATLGFFRMKAKSLVGLARAITKDHAGEVPRTMAELIKLPGVGRKTANVVMGVMWNAPDGVVVDTHVQRISQRLRWTRNTDPVKIEQELCKSLPRDRWNIASHILIFHGRRVCFARKPDCEKCAVNDTCPSAFEAEKVGRKPLRVRRIIPRTVAGPEERSTS